MEIQKAPSQLSRILALFMITGILFIVCLTIGCTRSSSYKKDHEPYDDNDESYYSDTSEKKDGMNQVEKLEKIKHPKRRVLLLAFWNDTPVGDDELGVFAANELKREMLTTRKVIFPEEKLVTSVTKDFVEGDRVQVSQLMREGRRVGVSTIIVGRIVKIIFRQDREEVGLLRQAESAAGVEVEIKVFDVNSGREVHSAKRNGLAKNSSRVVFDADLVTSKEARAETARQALHDAMVKLVPDVSISIEKMEWQGRIAKILGNKVYINAGRASGLLAGDVLKVMSPGEEIIDPVTKAYLGKSEGLLKGTLEVSDFIGKDSAMTLIHTGGNFQEGDVVRLY